MPSSYFRACFNFNDTDSKELPTPTVTFEDYRDPEQ